MNKDFNLQNFKSAVSNASNYLKGKGYEVPHSVMLNTLSVFLGAKNWNTLEAQFSKVNHNTKTIEKNIREGLIVVISEKKEQYIDYINNILIPSIIKDNLDSPLKILRYMSDDESSFHRENIFNLKAPQLNENIYYNVSSQNQYKDFQDIIRNSLRRCPDIICIGDINDDLIIDINIINASRTGHLVILGLQAKNENEIIAKLSSSIRINGFESISPRESEIDVKGILKKIINLN